MQVRPFGDVMGALTPRQVVDSQAFAFRLAHDPRVASVHDGGEHAGQLLFMHGCRISGVATVFKSGVQVPGNGSVGLPTVQATTTVHDPDTGVPLALLDGAAVTVLRTAGGVVAALELLAGGGEARRLGILGSGPQAQAVARLGAAVLPVDEVRMWSPTRPAEVPAGVTWADSAAGAVDGAGFVACCTSSREPVLRRGDLGDEVVLATMGSYSVDRCEVGEDITLDCAAVVIDQEAALDDVGPVVAGLAAGLPRRRVFRLGEDVVPGGGLRCFHSKGLGVQDAAVAAAVHWGWPAFEGRTATLIGTG